MSRHPARPPRLWRALVAAASPPADRSSILADLAEEHADRLATTPITAAAWYRRQVLSSLIPLIRRRLRLAVRRLTPVPRGRAPVTTLLHDVRYGWRSLRATPLMSLLVIAVLALGIGANTAIFSLLNPILLRPLPYRDAGRLVHMFQVDPSLNQLGSDMLRQSLPTLQAWNEASSFESVAGYYYTETALRSEGDGARGITTAFVSSHLFTMLGVEPALGRGFLSAEDAPGRNDVVILSHRQWQSQFGGDPAIVGRVVVVDGEPNTVVGVMAPDFNFPYGEVRAWKPAAFDPERWGPDDHSILTLGRLRPGVEIAQARQELAGILSGLGEEFGGAYAERPVRIVDLRRALVFFYDILGAMMLALLIAAGFVLLIACANVANLMLAQVGRRRREIAVRAAIGAARGRILRQLLTEHALVAAFAGVAGLFLARTGIGLVAPVVPAQLYRVGEIAIDSTAGLFALLLTLLTVVAFGLVPALRSSDARVTESLKEAPRGGRRGRRLTSALVFGQVATATLLCGGAFLAVEAAREFGALELGFEPRGVIAAQVALPRADYPTSEAVGAYHREARDAAASVPGVDAVGWISDLPLDFAASTRAYRLPGQATDAGRPAPQAAFAVISAGYVGTMGIPVLQGRDFDDIDEREAEPSVLVNRILASRLWPEVGAVGQTLLLDPGPEQVEVTVVGVIGDSLGGIALNGLQEQIYAPLAQRAYRRGFLVVRSDGAATDVVASLRAALSALDRNLPIDNVRSMEQVVAGAAAPLVAVRNLLAGLAMFALALAALGVYGVVSYSVAQRSHEIGVRMALGAHAAHIRRTVLRAAMVTVVAGAILGAVGTAALQTVLASAVGDEAASAPAGALVVAVVLVTVGLVAAWVPARRATRIDPLMALRDGVA